jgi:hypothetical protein
LQQVLRPIIVRAITMYAVCPRYDRPANDAGPGCAIRRQAARHPEADYAAHALPERSRQRTRLSSSLPRGDHSSPPALRRFMKFLSRRITRTRRRRIAPPSRSCSSVPSLALPQRKRHLPNNRSADIVQFQSLVS